MEPPSTWIPETSNVLGSSLRRLEDRPLLIGEGTFVGDLVTEGDLHARFSRSYLAHGSIVSIDVGPAREMDGVAVVATHADMGLGRIPGAGDERFARPILAEGRVRYVGEPVVVVAADRPELAVDAVGEIWVEIDPLPVMMDPEEAALDGGNLVARHDPPPSGDVDYPVRASVQVKNQRVAPAPLEGLAIRAARWGDGGLLVHCGHQAPHVLRDQLASQLGLDPGDVRVVVPDVGGGFGFKGGFFPEYVVVAALALQTGRAVVWEESRREHFLNGTHGRSMIHTVILEGESNGRIRRARIEILADVGAYPRGGAFMPELSRFVAQGLYDIDEVLVGITTVVTNKAPVGSYRGAGRPEAAYAIERAVDAFAREAGLDPVQVRALNLIKPDDLPYTTVSGGTYDSGNYPAALDLALKTVGFDEVRRRQAERFELGGDPIGLGVGAFVERAGGAADSFEFGLVRLTEDGALEAATGSTAAGQGHRTVWAQTIAEVFGVDPAAVGVIAGDTGRVEEGTGTFGSRSAQVGASAVFRTANQVAYRVKQIAAEKMEAAPDDLQIEAGRVQVVGDPTSSLSLEEVASYAQERGEVIAFSEMFVPGTQTFPYGVHVAVVEVERETGVVRILDYVAVDDCGNVLNPMIVEGQVHGALAQGVGQALFEGIEYSTNGDPLTSSFMDYLIPGATDLPPFTTRRLYTPAPSNPLGAKGTGEAGCIGAPPAVVNAVLDALGPFGVTHVDMPLRPHRVWSAIQGGLRPGTKQTSSL